MGPLIRLISMLRSLLFGKLVQARERCSFPIGLLRLIRFRISPGESEMNFRTRRTEPACHF